MVLCLLRNMHLHYYGHCYMRLCMHFRIKREDKNFFLDTGEFTRNKKIFSEESQNYFENKLLLSIHKKKYLTLIEADYLLKKGIMIIKQ